MNPFCEIAVEGAIRLKESGWATEVVNQDPEAPIFSIADFGPVGDLNAIVPALVEALG